MRSDGWSWVQLCPTFMSAIYPRRSGASKLPIKSRPFVLSSIRALISSGRRQAIPLGARGEDAASKAISRLRRRALTSRRATSPIGEKSNRISSLSPRASWKPLSLGRPDLGGRWTARASSRSRSTAAGVACAARQRHARGASAGLAIAPRAPLARGDLIFWKGQSGSCATRNAAARQRLAHEGGQRAAGRGGDPDRRRRRRRGYERSEAVGPPRGSEAVAGEQPTANLPSPPPYFLRRCRCSRSGC